MAPKKSASAAGAASPSPAATPSKAAAAQAKSAASTLQSLPDIAQDVWARYLAETPSRTKMVDSFLGFLMLVGGMQFLYCVLAGNYPFNAFLAGFGATVGQFVLAASLRMQTNPANRSEFSGTSDERAFADFVFGSLILHFFCVNFIN